MDSYIAAAVSAAMQPVLLELRALSDQISQISAWFPHVLATVDAVESLQGDTLGQLFEVKGQLRQAGDNRGAALCELGERLRSIQEELRGTPRLTPAQYQPSGKPRGWAPLPDQLDCTPTPPPTPPPSFLPPFPQLGTTPNPPTNEIPPPPPGSAGTLLPSAAPRGTLKRTKESYVSELPTHQPLASHHPAPRGPDGYVQQPHAWDTRPWQPPQPYRNRPWQQAQRQGYRHPGWVNPRFLPCTACDELGHRTRESLCEKSKPARPQNKVSKRTMGRKVLKPPPPCKPSLEKRLPTGSHPSISSNPATSWPPQPITVYPINSKPAFTLTGTVNGHRGTLLIGTGSAVTLVDRKAANTYQIVPTLQRVKGVTGDYLRLYGETQCSLVLPDPGRGTAPNTSVKIPARRKGPLLGDGCLQTFQPYDLGQICPTTRHCISNY
ncbi:unnamed protein product [Nesidiocoris tenuis]|uniref:Uncharacterized protein n=1 Tax=Nesidiocoris tenuis TaxID=355587 RepID=A0A6H5FXH8_9HEMI|nr:unnamed protein product [Nesidiocoris tenuis]